MFHSNDRVRVLSNKMSTFADRTGTVAHRDHAYTDWYRVELDFTNDDYSRAIWFHKTELERLASPPSNEEAIKVLQGQVESLTAEVQSVRLHAEALQREVDALKPKPATFYGSRLPERPEKGDLFIHAYNRKVAMFDGLFWKELKNE